jgi:hypothetical protein
MVDARETSGQGGAPRPQASSRNWNEQFAAVQPALRQTWLNLQVWLPFLANPPVLAKMVHYEARDCRGPSAWEPPLPKQCWECGRKDGLERRDYQRAVRSFERPMVFLGGGLGASLALFLLAAILFRSFLLFSLFLLLASVVAMAAGAGLVFLKSWMEQVRATLWTCPAHANAARCPDFVFAEGVLVLHAPNEAFAEAAKGEEQARSSSKSAADRGGPLNLDARGVPASPDAYRPQSHRPARLPDLPPIKLAGEEDEDEPAR